MNDLIGLFKFHIAHSEILLTGSVDEFYLACVKQNTTGKTGSDVCSLAK